MLPRFGRAICACGRGWSLLTIVLAAALASRLLLAANADVSWLIITAEKMLQGDRLYVDILEVNPPASVFIYLPPVLLARLIGLSPEIVVDVFVVAGALLALILAARALRGSGLLAAMDSLSLLGWSAAILLVLPMRTFGEREHVAVIALLPLWALLVARAGRARPDLVTIVLAGAGSGIAICIKPHFALAVGAAIVAAALHARSWRVIFAPENWIAGGLAAGYGLHVLIAYPEFIHDIIPLVQAVYLPVQMPLWQLVLRPAFLCWLATLRLLALWRPGALTEVPVSILVAASAGFALCYFIQAKGWPYHSYPMVALSLLALAVVGTNRAVSGVPAAATPVSPRVGLWMQRVMLAAIVIFGCAWNNFHRDMGRAVAPIRQAVAGPRMLVIASDFAIGHPLTRQVGGKWVGRVGSLWISAGVFTQLLGSGLSPETRARLLAYAWRDRDMLAEDIERARPDIIVVQRAIFDWYEWAQADPRIAPLLSAYRPLTTLDSDRGRGETFLILRRSDSPP